MYGMRVPRGMSGKCRYPETYNIIHRTRMYGHEALTIKTHIMDMYTTCYMYTMITYCLFSDTGRYVQQRTVINILSVYAIRALGLSVFHGVISCI